MKPFLTALIALFTFFNGQAQTASFSVNIEEGCAPLQIQCTDLSTGATSWSWTVNTVIPLTSSAANPGFAIVTPGIYTITLSINDGESTFSQNITAFKKPQPNFTADVTSGCAPLQVKFTDQTVLGDAPIVTWEWDMGEPPLNLTQNPVVVYNQNNTLDIALVVTDANGCSNFIRKNDYINIDKPPVPSFVASPTIGTIPFTTTVTNTTPVNQANLEYSWFFPGGTPTFVNQFDPGAITYNEMGVYFMSLSVIDNGCANDTSISIVVLPSDNIIKSQVFFDVNQNKIFDSQEHGIGNLATNISSNATSFLTNEDGLSIFYGESGNTYNLSWTEHPDWILTTDSSSFQVSLPQDPVQTYYFGLSPIVEVSEVVPYLTSLNTRCNTNVNFYLTALNSGTYIENGSVELLIDPLTDFVSYSIEPSDSSENKLTWAINDLWPGESFDVQLSIKLPNENFTGDTITFSTNTYMDGKQGDVTDIDTFSTEYKSVVRCSFDPNDKQVNPLGVGDEFLTLKKETLVYTVRFQNTGNDVAYDVTIKDILDSDLDLSTFKVIGSSHSVQTSLNQNTREAQFFFPNINLPDSTSNPEGSQGYVAFSIKPIAGLADNTIVENSADIIFDSNPAIVTNTVVSTLVDEIGNEIPNAIVNHLGKLIQISIYPNPFSEQAIFSIEGKLSFHYDLMITDVTGRTVRSYLDQSEKQVIINQDNLPKGLYFINVYESGQRSLIASQKIILE